MGCNVPPQVHRLEENIAAASIVWEHPRHAINSGIAVHEPEVDAAGS